MSTIIHSVVHGIGLVSIHSFNYYFTIFNIFRLFPSKFQLIPLSLDTALYTAPDGTFHHVSRFHDEVIQELFTHEVFSLLVRKKLIGLVLVQKILSWHHTGFNVHSQVRAQTKKEAERVGNYTIRLLLFLKRLFFDETEGKVRYQHSRQDSQEDSMDYLKFIARVTSYIPDKGQVMVRCYGLYSNAHRGKIRKASSALSHPPIIEEEPDYVPSNGWAEMTRSVYEVDPLLCPRCGSQMRIISFIEEPKIIERIIAHLKLTFEAERPASASYCPPGTPDGSRGERGIFLRGSVAAF